MFVFYLTGQQSGILFSKKLSVFIGLYAGVFNFLSQEVGILVGNLGFWQFVSYILVTDVFKGHL